MKAPALIFVVKITEYFLAALLVQLIAGGRGYAALAGLLSIVDTAVWFKVFGYTLDKVKKDNRCLVAYALGSGIGTFIGVQFGIKP